MTSSTSHQPQKPSDLPRLLVYCLLLSFLIHLLLIWLIPKYSPDQQSIPAEPTYVTLEELPPTLNKSPSERELDEPPRPDQERPENADRMAETNQRVKKEMAPRGEESRDQPAISVTSPPTGSQPSEAATDPLIKEKQELKDIDLRSTELIDPEDLGLSENKSSPQELTQLPPDTLKRIARNEKREKKKRRDDVIEGDAVYLNLQHDFLISFFKRFSDKIEAVWNYPEEAARRGEQGVLLLKVTVTREGKLLDVELLESSGFDALDYEAIQAIYHAAPFGPVTRHWPHEQMKIYAHFQYTLNNRYIYGR